MIPVALICSLTMSQPAYLVAQAQPAPKGAQTSGVVSGVVASSSGRPLSGMTMQLVDGKGTVVGTVTSAGNGTFTFPATAYDTYTLQCVADNKVIGTSSVTLGAATPPVKITCTSDATPVAKDGSESERFFKKKGVLTGLLAAAAALGATAVVATKGDASGSR
jgi:hypothetical protein